MAEAIGPGTPLICISETQPSALFWFKPPKLTNGALYFCEELYTEDAHRSETCCPWDSCGKIGIRLKDIRTKAGGRPPYCPNLFRPLNDGDTSLVKNEVYHQLTNLPNVEWKKLETIDE